MALPLDLQGAGCTIPLTEERAISVAQLYAVRRHLESHASKWIRNINSKRQKLMPEIVNLYDVATHLIKPATAERQCSFVELIASAPQPPKWFISHWWGEPVLAFTQCVSVHAGLRHLEEDTPYWICAYANNQWELSSEIATDPAQTSFRKAMRIAVGTLSIVDAEAVVFSRIWCGFEVAKAFEHKDGKLYDIASIDPTSAEPVILTDGLSHEDIIEGEQHGKDWQGGSQGYKMRRERRFPVTVVLKALETRIEQGQASVPEDKIRILNSIVEATDLEGTPPREHENYRHVNRALHGRIAAALYRFALEHPHIDIVDLQIALRASPCSELTLSFNDCDDFGEREFYDLVNNLPRGLESFDLDCTGCRELQIAFPNPYDEQTNLTKLSLNFARLPYLKDLQLRGLCKFIALTDLSMDFSMCTGLVDLSGLCSLSQLTQLENLFLVFSACPQVKYESMIEQGFRDLPNVKKMSVDFSGSNLSTPEQELQLPKSLVELSLSCARCGNIQNVSFLKRLGKITSLRALKLDFSGCSKLSNVAGLRCLLRLSSLKSINIILEGCSTRVSSIDSPEGLSRLTPAGSGHRAVRALATPSSSSRQTPVGNASSVPFIIVGNTAQPSKKQENKWEWVFYVRGATHLVDTVTLHLHESFKNPVQELRGPKFEKKFIGWGTFPIEVIVALKSGGDVKTIWELQFDTDTSKQIDVPPSAYQPEIEENRDLKKHSSKGQNATAASTATKSTWEVLGGGVNGGIVVREGEDMHSEKLDYLETGARIEELEVSANNANRIRYRLISGSGPDEGWVMIRTKDKELLKPLEEHAFPAP